MNIELTTEQAEAFKRGESITITPKPKQWEPEGGDYWGNLRHIGAVSNGVEVRLSAAMRAHNRLLAYVYEFGGDWVADWDNFCQDKYSLTHKNTCVGSSWSSWSNALTGAVKVMGTVYMSRECMNGLITKLKSGEVVL